jgi:phosphoribosylanthranilate isomerase
MWIKVCGVRDVQTAQALVGQGVDAIGLNFFRDSPRAVDVSIARDIVRALPAQVTAVGLFVNHPLEELRAICETCGLTTVQLHGDESAAYMSELRTLAVIRAVRVGEDVASAAAAELASYARTGVRPWAWLIEARVDGAYGGTGVAVDWSRMPSAEFRSGWPPLILAGGLTPANVAGAIRLVEPWGVDVASGVESSPGVKDLQMTDALIRAARTASATAS